MNKNDNRKLTTQRLALRKLKISDKWEIFKLRSDEEVLKYLEREKANSVDDAERFIKKILLGIEAGNWFFWAISLKNETKLIGTICLWKFSKEKDSAEIGYELLPDFQGNGFITEAVSEVIKFGFNTLNLSLIKAETVQENLSSVKVLKKNNFAFAAELTNSVMYELNNPGMEK